MVFHANVISQLFAWNVKENQLLEIYGYFAVVKHVQSTHICGYKIKKITPAEIGTSCRELNCVRKRFGLESTRKQIVFKGYRIKSDFLCFLFFDCRFSFYFSLWVSMTIFLFFLPISTANAFFLPN